MCDSTRARGGTAARALLRGCPRWALLAVIASGCARSDFVVDARGLSPTHDGRTLVAEVVIAGEPQAELSLDVGPQAQHTVQDLLHRRSTYGVVAWLDLDGDGRCDPRQDLAWAFVAGTDSREPLVWEVAEDALRDASGCFWFSSPADTGSPSGL